MQSWEEELHYRAFVRGVVFGAVESSSPGSGVELEQVEFSNFISPKYIR